MKFYEALEEVLEKGKRIRRPHWATNLSLGRGTPYLQDYIDGLPVGGSSMRVSQAEIIAQDWEIVNTKVKKTKTLWINLYPESDFPRIAGHSTKEEANKACTSNRIACKEVTFEWEEES